MEEISASNTSEILVLGKTTNLPDNLYIPPNALRVVLESFTGPLDLLLYLIRRQNLDILDIPVAEVTGQYMQYVEMMRTINLELAAEYLVMAAILAEVKSRMLLPKTEEAEEDDEDPRAELVRRLQEYEQFKHAADDIEALPQIGKDHFIAHSTPPKLEKETLPELELRELLLAFSEVSRRAALYERHNIAREPLSVRERMSNILDAITNKRSAKFSELFTVEEGRSGAVVALLAILELIKAELVSIVQSHSFAEIYLSAREPEAHLETQE
jgi:segregation and condensation protein A